MTNQRKAFSKKIETTEHLAQKQVIELTQVNSPFVTIEIITMSGGYTYLNIITHPNFTLDVFRHTIEE